MSKDQKRLKKLLKKILKADLSNASDLRLTKMSSNIYTLKRKIDPYDDRSVNDLIRQELNLPNFRRDPNKRI